MPVAGRAHPGEVAQAPAPDDRAISVDTSAILPPGSEGSLTYARSVTIRPTAFLRELARLTGPLAVQQLLVALSGSVDVMLVAGQGQTALAAVSLAVQVQFVFSLFTGGLVLGMSVLVAQHWGAGDRPTSEAVTGLAMREAALVSAVFVLATALAPRWVMSVFTDERALIEQGAVYLRASCVVYLATAVSQVLLCLMRNTGAAALGTTVSVVGLALHAGLGLVLVGGLGPAPELGVGGVAAALVVSRFLEAAWMLGCSLRPGRPRADRGALLRPGRALVRAFWALTLPVLANMLVWGGGFTTYTVIMGRLGEDVVAANAVALLVKDLLVCVCLGLGGAGAILVGNRLGRGDLAAARAAGRSVCWSAVVAGALTGLVILAIRPLVVTVAGLSPAASRDLSVMLVVCAYYVIGKSVNATIVSGILPAGGDTRFGLICDIVAMWCLVIPVGALAAFVWHWPPLAVYVLLNSDEILKIPAVIWRYRTHRWLRTLSDWNSDDRHPDTVLDLDLDPDPHDA